MGIWGRFHFTFTAVCLCSLLLPQTCLETVRNIATLRPGFQGSQMNWVDNNGIFLVSNNSNFCFGFTTTDDGTLFLLVITHMITSTIVWSANRNSPVQNSDYFVFDDNGNAYLKSHGTVVWSTDSAGKGASQIELQDSGNLVVRGNDSSIIWQSFSHPTDTLLSNQNFTEGMKLVSNVNSRNLSYSLEIMSGDMILYAGFQSPQPYWSMRKDRRKIIDNNVGYAKRATLGTNLWSFYDGNDVLLWQFIFTQTNHANVTWAAVLGSDGVISFFNLQNGGLSNAAPTKIPKDSCSRPEGCDPYYACYSGNMCRCLTALSSGPICSPGIVSPCDRSRGSMELVNAGDGINYFALGLVQPSSSDTDLDGCKSYCLGNCTCLALFFEQSSGNCYMFDQIGSFQGSNNGSGVVSYIKVLSSGGNKSNSVEGESNKKHFPYVVIIVILTVLVIATLTYAVICYNSKQKKKLMEIPKESLEEDNFWEEFSGMPSRFRYKDLETATNNFSVILGQGGFGSVYHGTLPDGTQLAVKKLEGIGQGKKEFRAEVSIIGSIHHIHLVRLKGFCAEGTHRLLAYEYLANGSLERWLFGKTKDGFVLDWDKRYNIVVGTAKGLAYLHEDCDAKIIHCDIKPENVLLDDNYVAKVSDFGLAKLMTREQSHVFTTLRGTRGYLAPEWITNYAISEKSDVFSFGMVLLEIIGGRKNYDPRESSEKSHFPSYAFKMLEEGKLMDIVDSNMTIDEKDERVLIAINVALWCIQDDMHLRPPMTKVVQMLEGICPVSPPPSGPQMGSRLYLNFFDSTTEDKRPSSGPSDRKSEAYLSDVHLSGPR